MQNNSVLDYINVDRRSTVDFSLQLKENIKGLILDRTLFYQRSLPSINELSTHLQLESSKVEKAYNQLIKERYISAKNGNYQVSYVELTNYFFEKNTSIYDAVIDLGLTPSIDCLEKKMITLTEFQEVAMGFEPSEKKEYLYINRLYLGNEQPIIILENYLPLHIFDKLEEEFKGHEPLNDYIGKRYGFKAHISKRKIKAVNLDKKLAEILHERTNAASIQSTNQVYDVYNRMIDYGQSHSVSNYYFQSIIKRTEIDRNKEKAE